MKINIIAISDVGRIRENNEDNYYINGKYRWNLSENNSFEKSKSPASNALIAVSDGMGGEDLGELASWITVQNLKPSDFANITPTALDSIKKANEEICNEIKKNKGRRIGATLAALYIDDEKAIGCNIGDSRIYLLRDKALKQISHDHNKAEEMISMGLLTREEAADHKSRHMLTQHLGIFSEEMLLEPYFSETVFLKKHDIFLLCSDGLTDMLTEEEILSILNKKTPLISKAKCLVNSSLKKGGRDNITVILGEIL